MLSVCFDINDEVSNIKKWGSWEQLFPFRTYSAVSFITSELVYYSLVY